MFEVFTEQIEVLIKEGISNLYWYKGDLKKLWLRSGVPSSITEQIFKQKNVEGNLFTKRQMLDSLYEHLRTHSYVVRLEVSRNFVRTLIEHNNFVPQAENHRVERAEMVALKLKDIIDEQRKSAEKRDIQKSVSKNTKLKDQEKTLARLQQKFVELSRLKDSQKRGYEFEKLFTDLMRANEIPVVEPFKIIGEQIDGGIKYEGHYYVVELRWRKKKANQQDIAGLFLKAEGKLEARAIFISMEGYSKEVLESLPKGKGLKVILFDGAHLANAICGNYRFTSLLEHSITEASLRGEIYCSHDLK